MYGALRAHEIDELWTAQRTADAITHTVDGAGPRMVALVERAALCVANELDGIQRDHPAGEEGGLWGIYVLCGPGVTGAIGLAAARIVKGRSIIQRICVIVVTEKRLPVVDDQLAIAREQGVEILDPNFEEPLPESDHRPIIVDAMQGSGTFRPEIAAAVSWVNAADAYRFAIGAPTGVDPDSGSVVTEAVQARMTFTFLRSSPGLYIDPGRACAGTVVVADVGIVDPDAWDNDPIRGALLAGVRLPDPASLWRMVERRYGDDEVYELIDPYKVAVELGELGESKGSVTVLAGELMAPGPAALLGVAARELGTRHVTVRCEEPDRVRSTAPRRPGLDFVEADDTTSFGPPSLFIVGPGGFGAGLRRLRRRMYVGDRRPALWDGEAVVELASALGTDPVKPRSTRIVVLRVDEAASVLLHLTGDGWGIEDVEAARADAAHKIARHLGAITVLKGSCALVANGRRLAISTIGAGDEPGPPELDESVAGVIAALVTRGMGPWLACCCGVSLAAVASRMGQGRDDPSMAVTVAKSLSAAMFDASAESPWSSIETSLGWPEMREG